MPLSAAQKAQVKKILKDYRTEVRAIVKKHQATVMSAVTAVEKKKIDQIEQLIKGV